MTSALQGARLDVCSSPKFCQNKALNALKRPELDVSVPNLSGFCSKSSPIDENIVQIANQSAQNLFCVYRINLCTQAEGMCKQKLGMCVAHEDDRRKKVVVAQASVGFVYARGKLVNR